MRERSLNLYSANKTEKKECSRVNRHFGVKGLGNSFINDGIVTGNDKGNEVDHLI